eukprot:2885906-Alexandrium_andersonii.AAC.1
MCDGELRKRSRGRRLRGAGWAMYLSRAPESSQELSRALKSCAEAFHDSPERREKGRSEGE